jgi:hypothetical protein
LSGTRAKAVARIDDAVADKSAQPGSPNVKLKDKGSKGIHMVEKLGIAQISFKGVRGDPSPYVVIYNPKVLPPALTSQIQRFGLVSDRGANPVLAGQLKGNRRAFTEMIQSYGVTVEVVPAVN